MYRSGLVNTLVTHANMKGLDRTPLLGDRRGFMPPQLKANKTKITQNVLSCSLNYHYLIRVIPSIPKVETLRLLHTFFSSQSTKKQESFWLVQKFWKFWKLVKPLKYVVKSNSIRIPFWFLTKANNTYQVLKVTFPHQKKNAYVSMRKWAKSRKLTCLIKATRNNQVEFVRLFWKRPNLLLEKIQFISGP